MRGGGGSEEMRKKVEVVALSLTVITLIAVSSAGSQPPLRYNIDGDLSDWGVDLTGNWSLNETWVPNDGIEFIVENNYDPNTPTYAWNYNDTQDQRWQGVHIKGIAPNYTVYDEPVVWCPGLKRYVAEPYGGEPYDLEAKYLDQDKYYIYVAIVTSVPPNATGVNAPGDLGLDIDRNASTGEWGYEYGVKLGTKTGLTQWEIGYLPDWEPNYVIDDNSPGIFKDYLPGGGKTGEAIGAYVQGPTCTEGPFMDKEYYKPTYIIEMAIPKSAVGVTGNLSQGMIHHTDACGNDKMDNPIPEFMTVVIPAAALICFVFFIHRRRWGEGK